LESIEIVLKRWGTKFNQQFSSFLVLLLAIGIAIKIIELILEVINLTEA
jgi:hypothetical protein